MVLLVTRWYRNHVVTPKIGQKTSPRDNEKRIIRPRNHVVTGFFFCALLTTGVPLVTRWLLVGNTGHPEPVELREEGRHFILRIDLLPDTETSMPLDAAPHSLVELFLLP